MTKFIKKRWYLVLIVLAIIIFVFVQNRKASSSQDQRDTYRTKKETLEFLSGNKELLLKKFNVTDISLFGSFARNEADDESDIDIVVTLSKPLGFAFIRLAEHLEEKLGRKVDLITATTLELGIADPRRAHIHETNDDRELRGCIAGSARPWSGTGFAVCQETSNPRLAWRRGRSRGRLRAP